MSARSAESLDKGLNSKELHKLNLALDLAHAIEREWPRQMANLPRLLQQLREVLDLWLQRLSLPLHYPPEANSKLAVPTQEQEALFARLQHFSEKMSLESFVVQMVPFERLSNRGLRDDDFLVSDSDQKPEAILPRGPLIGVVDQMRSAFNVGSLFRTMDCVGGSELWLAGYTPTPQDTKMQKTTMGADQYVKWRHFRQTTEVFLPLTEMGFQTVALETSDRAIDLNKFSFPKKTALIVGNERFGVDHQVLRQADHVVRLPLHGAKNSLNASIAFAIAAFEWRKQWEQND